MLHLVSARGKVQAQNINREYKMISSKLGESKRTLVVSSNWDSGTFKSFQVCVVEDGEYGDAYDGTLNNLLTDAQIRAVEATILFTVENFIKHNEECKND